ncbi:hypothetical protein [Neorhizobium sp. IRS_2294]|uniref:hypothetical protein n=1 Tax=unclassified Neorhizobium TaxID=2629175 RepID=UPI003D2C2BA2
MNDLLIPGSALYQTLARYADQLLTWNDDPVYRVSTCGSTSLLRYQGRYLAVCTWHQLKYRDLESVSLLTRDGQLCLSSEGIRHLGGGSENEWSDIAVFDFTEPCRHHTQLKERFFEFRKIPPNAVADDTLFLVVAGYPYKDQVYELEELNHLGMVKRRLVCLLHSQPADDCLLLLKLPEAMDFDPDGLSGGTAFSVQVVDGKFQIYYAGMIMRAGGEFVYILKSGYIRQFLDMALSQPLQENAS